jgi:hypothetical protein
MTIECRVRTDLRECCECQRLKSTHVSASLRRGYHGYFCQQQFSQAFLDKGFRDYALRWKKGRPVEQPRLECAASNLLKRLADAVASKQGDRRSQKFWPGAVGADGHCFPLDIALA